MKHCPHCDVDLADSLGCCPRCEAPLEDTGERDRPKPVLAIEGPRQAPSSSFFRSIAGLVLVCAVFWLTYSFFRGWSLAALWGPPTDGTGSLTDSIGEGAARLIGRTDGSGDVSNGDRRFSDWYSHLRRRRAAEGVMPAGTAVIRHGNEWAAFQKRWLSAATTPLATDGDFASRLLVYVVIPVPEIANAFATPQVTDVERRDGGYHLTIEPNIRVRGRTTLSVGGGRERVEQLFFAVSLPQCMGPVTTSIDDGLVARRWFFK